MDRWIRTVDDVLTLLDGLFAPDTDRWTARGAGWWDEFYGDRARPVPFFAPVPDENLVSYLDDGLLEPGRALELGCGPGRNAAGAMGCELPDEQLYRDGQLHGGLAYTPDALRSIFSDFDEVEVRPMREQPRDAPAFGIPFLLTALFRRPWHPTA
jgi:hypothetical protein